MRVLFVQATLALLLFLQPPAVGAQKTIYRCEIDGVPTFSDHQCAPGAQAVQPTPINTAQAVTVKAPSATPKAKPRAEPVKDTKHAETCAKLALSLKETRSKMRSGYSAKEGEKLRARQDNLRDRQKIARCS